MPRSEIVSPVRCDRATIRYESEKLLVQPIEIGEPQLVATGADVVALPGTSTPPDDNTALAAIVR